MNSTDPSPSPSSPAPILKACRSCARAKAKCVTGQEPNGKCKRCHRLQKICEPAIAQVRGQPRKRKLPPTSRSSKTQVEKLEQKLDGLVTLLKSAQNLNPSLEVTSAAQSLLGTTTCQQQPLDSLLTLNQQTQPLHFSQPTSPLPAQNDGQWRGPSVSFSAPAIAPATPTIVEARTGNLWASRGWYAYKSGYPVTGPSAFPPQMSSCHDPQPDFHVTSLAPSWEHANILLDRFRQELIPCFPFISLSQSVTAEQLHRDKPFFYYCVLAVSSRNPSQQTDLGKSIMKQIAERMYVNGERNLDLLLGILTYAGLCYFHFWNIPQLTSLLSAAMTLIWDLGLGKSLPTASPNRSPFEEAIRESSALRYLTLIRNGRTLEERRAFLGIFFLSSAVFAFFRRTAAIQWSPYVDECLQYLLENEKEPNDKVAVALVKLQMIIEKIHQSPWQDRSGSPGISTATMFIVNSLGEQLKQFRKDIPPGLEQNAILFLHYHCAEISLYEVGLCREQLQIGSSGPQFQRLDALYACLQACKSFFDTFFSIPVVTYYSFSMPTWSTITCGMIILQMLSVFEHPDWNLDYVRETLDFKGILDQISEKLASVQPSLLDGQDSCLLFSRMGEKIGTIKRYIDGKSHLPCVGLEPLNVQNMEATKTGVDFTDFLDDAWFRDILGPFEYQSNTAVV